MLIIRFRIFSLFLVFSIFLSGLSRAFAGSEPAVSAESCVLMYSDGACIYEKAADTRQLIASTTKIMTAILAIENTSPEETVPIKESYCRVEGSSMYLDPEEAYTVKDLLLGLLLASGNDAALALAHYVAGSEKAFVKLMNEKARELGLQNTSFANPHGLDAPGHYSTARDMAKLMLYCMENETFRDLADTYSATVNDHSYVNHNKLLVTCPGCIGGKTGYTMAAGRCLVSCCERNGLRFVCVTLSAPDDWTDHITLYNWAYDNFVLKELSDHLSFEIPVISGNRKMINVKADITTELLVPADETLEVYAELPRFVFAPVNLGETAGKFWVIIENNIVAKGPLVYASSCQAAYPCLDLLSPEVTDHDRENTENYFRIRADVQARR